jgi:hypothetical protein
MITGREKGRGESTEYWYGYRYMQKRRSYQDIHFKKAFGAGIHI